MPPYGMPGDAAAAQAASGGGFLPFGGGTCTLCQNPRVQEFLFFTAVVAAIVVWYTIIED